jgi:hypothetical protein
VAASGGGGDDGNGVEAVRCSLWHKGSGGGIVGQVVVPVVGFWRW